MEPISLLDRLPSDPSLLKVRSFDVERIQKLTETFGSKRKVLDVLEEFTDLPSYVPDQLILTSSSSFLLFLASNACRPPYASLQKSLSIQSQLTSTFAADNQNGI